MKRNIIMLMMAVAAVVACQKQNAIEDKAVIEELPDGSYIYTVKASVTETKSDYDGSGVFSWSSSDAISVLFHKETDNQFFTLTRTSGSGNSATFSGVITAGYEIGASNTGKIWALYPANANHSYTPDANDNRPSFYTPSVIDLSGGNYSANIPMYDVLDSEGSFSFKYMTAAMKFTINDLDVSKIKVEIENGVSYGFSGLTTMGSNYLRYSDPTADQKKITFICDVTSKTASFILSGRYSSTAFKPTITIKNYSNGYTIKKVVPTTAKALTIASSSVPRVTISAPGEGVPFEYAYGINWDTVAAAATGVGNNCINSVKAAADENYFYLYLDLDGTKLLQGDYKYANSLTIYVGTEESSNTSWMWNTTANANNTYTTDVSAAWLMYNGAPKVSGQGYDILNTANVATIGDRYFYEIKFNRSNSKLDLTSASTLHLGALIYYQKYHDGTSSGSLGDGYYYSPYGVDAMLVVSLP